MTTDRRNPGAEVLARVLDSFPHCIWRAEVDNLGLWRCVFCSPTVEGITGRPAEYYMLRARRWLGTIHRDDRRHYLDGLLSLKNGASKHEEEYRIICRDKTIRWVREHVVVTRLSERRVRLDGIVSLIADSEGTEQRASEIPKLSLLSRNVVDYGADAFFLHVEGTIVDVNRQACRSLGYSRRELIGMDLSSVDVGHGQDFMKGKAGVLADWNSTFESVQRRKDGSMFPVEVRVRPIGEKELLAGLLIARDITERTRADRLIRMIHVLTQLTVGLTPASGMMSRFLAAVGEVLGGDAGAFWRPDDEAGVLRCLDTWLRPSIEEPQFDRVSREATFARGVDLPGRVWQQRAACHILDVAKDPSFVRSVAAEHDGLHSAFAVPILFQDEVLGIIEFYSREILAPDQRLLETLTSAGNQIGLYMERSRSQEALQEAESDLARVGPIVMLGELTASIAHEVKQPISAAMSNANAGLRWLRADPPNLAKARRSLNAVVTDMKRADEVINHIRALVKKEPHEEPTDINDVVRKAVVLTQPALKRHDISLLVHPAEAPPKIPADPIQLQQVLINLILNSKDAFDDECDGAHEIRINVGLDQGAISVEVRDNGGGFSKEGLAHLFQSFYTTKKQGMGMGLAICRSIVEAHGGQITAEANQPHGAIFRFTLPVPQHALPAPSCQDNKVIAVVDDDKANRDALTALINSFGYSVKEFSVARDFLCMSGLADVACLVSDVEMPGMTGIELFHELRSRGRCVPVILMTGRPSKKERERLIGEGVTAYLEKPLSENAIFSAIRSVLAHA